MNELQNRKVVRDLQKPIPGCMGRIVNILDLNAGMPRRKMLTDRANRDSSPVCKNRPEVPKKVVDPVTLHREDKQVTCELKMCSSKKSSNGTPMKMLIAQEMSRGTETKQKPPSVVAKLMGLDALPAQQPASTTERTSHGCYKNSASRRDISPSDVSASSRSYGQQENGYLDKTTKYITNSSKYYLNEQQEYKDVYEIWAQPSRSGHKNYRTLSKSHSEDTNENRMALVRQKFMEAKRLATDQRLVQTKEFQDALEILNSNRDLFLKFLEEPNSLFSKHLQDLQTAPTSPQAKCITVLKPSNAVKHESVTEMRKQQTLEDEQVHKNSLSWSQGYVHPRGGNLPQPTRIVVLKPSPRRLQDLKCSVSSPTSSRGLLKGRDHFEESETDETRGSREVAKDITQKMWEGLSGNQIDETLFSSVLPHGYVGDESSFNRSEHEFIEEDDGNFSDTEIVTPTSRHSWDYVYRFGSPYSLSSQSQASYSPESSVIREAKKRLSERWTMVASNGISQQKHVHKSSSTLGEMLAISESKKGKGNDMLSSRSCGGEQDARLPVACSSFTRNEDEGGESDSPRNLLRSKSVPVFSSAYDNIGLNVEVSDSQVSKSNASKDLNGSKSGKLSLRGKVSSLFFSRNKRATREKTASFPLVGTSDRVQSANVEYIGKRNSDFPVCTTDIVQGTSQHSEGVTSDYLQGPSQHSEEATCETSSLPASSNDRTENAAVSTKAALSLETPKASENTGENLDQPSPISVLEAHFEDDVNSNSSQSSEGANVECCQLISRSPPIESMARSLAWDEARTETSPLELSKILQKKDEEQYSFAKALLNAAGFGNEKSSSVLSRWHSPNSPLDPLLLDKFLEHKDDEGKCRERRAQQRLLFDCVNAALLDICWTNMWDKSQAKVRKTSISHIAVLGDASVTEEVWGHIKEWFQDEEKQATLPGENISLVVDRVLRKEVADGGWAGVTVSSQMDEIGKEIQEKVLEEMVEEALVDFIPGWF